ncbi:dihydroorotate dehydrogenase electron transfer subunit [Bifidobacterium xylocopae]
MQRTPAPEVGVRHLPGRRTGHVSAQRSLAQGVYMLTIRDAPVARNARPGQFVNLYPNDRTAMLPRPFGIAGVHGDEFDLIYQRVGAGTRAFARLSAGDPIDLVGPLGRPYDLTAAGDYLLIGGGLGVPPLISAAQGLAGRGDVRAIALFGYRDARFADGLVGRFADRTLSVSACEGNVITLLDRIEPELEVEATTILSCGPIPMMRAVAAWAGRRSIRSQFSLEERMGCGYGACLACVVDTTDGRLRVCKDGPVFAGGRLEWETAR